MRSTAVRIDSLRSDGVPGRLVANLCGRHGIRFFGLHQLRIPGDASWKTAFVTGVLMKAIVNNHPVPWLDICLRVIYRDGVHAVQVLDTVVTS